MSKQQSKFGQLLGFTAFTFQTLSYKKKLPLSVVIQRHLPSIPDHASNIQDPLPISTVDMSPSLLCYIE